VINLGNNRLGLAPIRHTIGTRGNCEMRFEAENLLLEIVIEPRHHAEHDDQHGDAEHHADHANQSDDRDESAFRPQITQRDHQFERQSRHPAQPYDPAAPAVKRPSVIGCDYKRWSAAVTIRHLYFCDSCIN
jgi:hypothetical protein